MQLRKMWLLAVVVVMFVASFVPATAFALAGGNAHEETTPLLYQHEAGAEESAGQGDTAGGGAGFVLAFLAGLIALIIAVVAVIGAVGLGIIGIGYASVGGSEE